MQVSPVKTLLVNASVLMSGTVVAQIVTFGLSFLIARIYLPAEFGRYSMFVGCAGVLAAAATGAYDRLVLLARTPAEARQVATLTFVISTLGACVVFCVGLIYALVDGVFVRPLPPIDVIVFLPLFIVLYARAQIFVYSSLREDRARLLSVLKMVQSTVMGLVQLAASGLAHVSGLIVGNLAGWCVLAVAGVRWRWLKGRYREDLRLHSLSRIARTNSRFPRYVMPNEVIDNLSNQVPILIIGSTLSLADAGHYGLAIMILSAPSAVIGQALGQSFLQYLGTQAHDPVLIRQLMYRVWIGMACAAVLPFLVVLVEGEQLFSFAFGANWAAAGAVAQSLAILLFVRFVSSPTSSIYLKLGMQKEQWYFCLAAAIYRTGAYSLAFFGWSLTSVIWAHVIAEVVFIALYNLTAVRRLAAQGKAYAAAP